MFIYGVIWSFGVSVDTISRKQFDLSFKKIIVGDITTIKKKKTPSFPEKLSLFDYMFKVNEDKLSYEWIKWVDMIEERYNKDIPLY